MKGTRPIYSALDIGHVRERNEDFLLVDRQLGFAVVTDGIGGHSGGDLAAKLAAGAVHNTIVEHELSVQALRSGQGQLEAEGLAKIVGSSLQRASRAIRKEALENDDLDGMSTTCTLFLDLGTRALIGHVGDSRAYLLCSDRAIQLTRDHVAQLRSTRSPSGEILKRNVLTRSVGFADECEVDLFFVELESHDRILLCSDGLSDLLRDEDEIVEAVDLMGARYGPDVLIDLARQRGAPDNVAIVLIDKVPLAATLSPDAEAAEAVLRQMEALRSLKPFRGASLIDVRRLLACGHKVRFERGQRITPSGDLTFGVIIEGFASLEAGDIQILAGPGECLGEAAFSGRPWAYEVTSHDAQVVMLMFQREALVELALRKPESVHLFLIGLLDGQGQRTAELFTHIARRSERGG